MQDSDPPPTLGGGGEHCHTEHIACGRLRTGKGEEDASRFDLLEGLAVELAIADKSILDRATMLGEGRRIQDDQILGVCRHCC